MGSKREKKSAWSSALWPIRASVNKANAAFKCLFSGTVVPSGLGVDLLMATVLNGKLLTEFFCFVLSGKNKDDI